MGKMQILSGRFGRWTVLEMVYSQLGNRKRRLWRCLCDCGNVSLLPTDSLSKGKSQSCGCLRVEVVSRANRREHKYTQTKEYRTYSHIKTRCYNEKYEHFSRYGGRGIKVCDRWLESFANFLEDMGKATTPKHTIERIDNDGNYEPSNCKWATRAEQAINKGKYTQSMEARLRRSAISTKKYGKPVLQIGIDGNVVGRFECIKRVRNAGFDRASVSRCCSGQSKTHRGFLWKYDL